MNARPPTSEARHRRWVWFGLALAIILDSITQIVWKEMVMRVPTQAGIAGGIRVMLFEPLFAVLLALLAAQFFNWMMVISRSDISFAQPITALSYVVVAALAAFYFGEHFSATRGAAILLILAGVWLIGTTPVQTVTHPPGGRR